MKPGLKVIVTRSEFQPLYQKTRTRSKHFYPKMRVLTVELNGLLATLYSLCTKCLSVILTQSHHHYSRGYSLVYAIPPGILQLFWTQTRLRMRLCSEFLMQLFLVIFWKQVYFVLYYTPMSLAYFGTQAYLVAYYTPI